MIERCRIAHFDDLKPHQQVQMLEVLTGVHQSRSPETLPQFGLNGGRPVALLKDGKIIAAIVTDEQHNVLHWAGRPDRKFLKEVGHSPAIAIMRAHLAQRGDKKITFVGPASDAATNLFYNRFFVEGKTELSKKGRISTIAFTDDLVAKLKSKISSSAQDWRLHRQITQ